jgi:hypothetical protein
VTRRERDLRRLLQSVADAHGATVEIEDTGGHFKAHFKLGGGSRFITISRSPRVCVDAKIRSDAKRALRFLETAGV